MSRGFIREDDQEEAPFIPARAPLPDGVTNHVTERGIRLLLAEREQLEQERSSRTGSEDERRRELAVLNGKLDLLNERISSARPMEPPTPPIEEVRFGTTVTFAYMSGSQKGVTRTFTIVGVDEASVNEHRIAFTAPIARALTGKRVGDVVEFRLGAQVQELRITAIT